MEEFSMRGPVEPTRRSFLGRAATVAAAAVPAGVLLAGQARADDDDGEGRFHRLGKLFAEIRKDENDHVAFLIRALGSQAYKRPTFHNLEQRHIGQFVKVSQALENTGSGAYLGAAPILNSRIYLAAAGSIALIEGRHAGWLNTLENDPLTYNVFGKAPSFERPLTVDEIHKLTKPFIADLNGNPFTFSSTPSDANDVAILNFALVLEHLEAEFYNVNVRKFFRDV